MAVTPIPSPSQIDYDLLRSIFDSADGSIAVLNSAGSIIAVNERWREFGRALGAPQDMIDPVGRSYSEICSAVVGDISAGQVLKGISQVLAGQQTNFELTYECPTPESLLFFQMIVTQLDSSSGGALVIRRDITREVLHRVAEYEREALGAPFVVSPDSRRAAERAPVLARLVHDVAVAANSSGNAEDAVQRCLDIVCEAMKFPVGHALLARPGDEKTPASIWRVPDREKFASLIELSEQVVWQRGMAEPWDVLALRKPAWRSPIGAAPEHYPRAKAAVDVGITIAVQVPVLVGDRVEALLEFAQCEPLEPDDELNAALMAVGAQVSRVLERRRVLRAIQDSEELYRSLVSSFPNGNVLVFDRELRCVLSDGNKLRFPKNDAIGRSILELFPPDAVELVEKSCRAALLGSHSNLELDDRTCDEVLAVDVVPIGADGKLGMLVTHDITQIKRSETLLRENQKQLKVAAGRLFELASRLVHAQEEERRRIARELHDDFGQRVAYIRLRLGALTNKFSDLGTEGADEIRHLQNGLSSVAEDLRNMSHELHPAVLDMLGIVASLRASCDEFSRLNDIRITFESEFDSLKLPRPVEICLYRVLQETLRNVAKHSGASAATVLLRLAGDQVEMCVHDMGRSFAPERVRGSGLGLISMEERVRLVGGSLSVESSPETGTQISIRLPLQQAN